jgi:transposase
MGLSPRKSNSDLLVAKKSCILTLKDKSYTFIAISTKIGIPRSTIFSFLIKYTKSGSISFESKPGRGRKPKLNTREERALVHIVVIESK